MVVFQGTEAANSDGNADRLIAVSIAFVVLTVFYFAQLYFIRAKLNQGSGNSRVPLLKEPDELWPFGAMSLGIPFLFGLLPDMLTQRSEGNLLLFHGVRFLIAYLVTIVTLELALLVHIEQTRTPNPWGSLLRTNLMLDIVSIIIFYIYKELFHAQSNAVVIAFFLLCSIATILTGLIVVCGSYSVVAPGDL